MSTARTVFVIGAGAGYDYNMPLGEDLISEIATLISSSRSVRSIDVGRISRHQAEYVRGFEKALDDHFGGGDYNLTRVRDLLLRIRSGLVFSRSIDTLLTDADDQDVSAAGKIAISFVIANAESSAAFLTDKDRFATIQSPSKKVRVKGEDIAFRKTWMPAFFRELRAGLSLAELEKRLSETCIVNFNYDRLIERFLDLAFMQYDGLDLQEAMRLRSLMKIVHPYGMLAKYPSAIMGGRDALAPIDFGMVLTKGQLKDAPSAIMTYDETIDSNLDAEIKLAVAGAERLIFLGFGFHPQNLRLLGLPAAFGTADQKRFYASSLGLSNSKRVRLQQAVARPLNTIGDEAQDRCYFDMETCLDLINEHGDDFFPPR